MTTRLVICDLDAGCIASDGTTQPKGTVLNRIVAAADFDPGPGLALAEDDGRPIYHPAAAAAVPDQVPNASARRVMQQQFVPDGRSFYTVVDSYLRAQVTATAALADNDPQKIAALGAWTQWDMGNFFLRADPLVEAMAQIIAANGGSVDLDAMFIAADAL